MKTRAYQIALIFSVAVCILLAATLAYVLVYPRRAAAPAGTQDPVVARGPETSSSPVQHADNALATSEPTLAPIQISPRRLQQIGVTTATAQIKNVSDQLNVPGNVVIDEERLSYVQTRFPGWIQDVYANATYQYVHKGQPLFTVYSPDLVSSEQEYLLAKQNQNAFSSDMHNMAAHESGWLLKAAEERLLQFGVSPKTITDLAQSGKVQRNITIDSPVSGYITERTALPNAYVQPETKLYTIADLSTVWVYANVFQNDTGRLKPGDTAQVTVDAYPGRKFNGRIDQILPEVDPTTRTVRVRLIFRNPGVVLKPGMFVNVAISLSLGRQLVIPASAVLQSGPRAIAFVDHGNGSLEPRTIQVGPQFDDSLVVLSGLKAGENVVSSANFLVDSEAQLQSALSSFTSPAQPATTGAPSTPAEQLKIDLTTDPSPPRKGANIVRIKLAGPDGKPMSGVHATATFFMPAMPAMGMAAEHAVATLADKGNGVYEGPVQLPSGGTFSVTITVQRNGATIATKQLSVNATGGM